MPRYRNNISFTFSHLTLVKDCILMLEYIPDERRDFLTYKFKCTQRGTYTILIYYKTRCITEHTYTMDELLVLQQNNIPLASPDNTVFNFYVDRLILFLNKLFTEKVLKEIFTPIEPGKK